MFVSIRRNIADLIRELELNRAKGFPLFLSGGVPE